MDIGFIGAGRMGFHMVRRLIEAGHTSDRLRHQRGCASRASKKLGAKRAASPAEVADRVETVMVEPADAGHRAQGRDRRRRRQRAARR